jgi:hypothetical protein
MICGGSKLKEPPQMRCHRRETKSADISPLSAPSKRFRFERHIKTLNQRIMATYRLPIAIEHALPKWPLVDFRKKFTLLSSLLIKPKRNGFVNKCFSRSVVKKAPPLTRNLDSFKSGKDS